MADGFVIDVKSPRHKKVLDALLARIDMSDQAISNETKKWDEAEKTFRFYLPEDSADALRRSKREGGKPQYTKIEVPYAYAQMLTAHTYFCSTFLSRAPVWQFSGRHGESEMNCQAVESLIDYQANVGCMLPALYVWLHDASKYGLGIIFRYWENEKRTVSEIVREPLTLFGVEMAGRFKDTKITRVIDGYQGNRLFNVRPYDYICDPRVPINAPQTGEFVGRHTSIGWNTIMKRKASGQYFNIDWVEKFIKTETTRDGSKSLETHIDSRIAKGGDVGTVMHSKTSLVAELPAVELVVELIPKEWELGSTENPEKWVFTVFDRKCIVEAKPYAMFHDLFPVGILETEVEGYTFVKRGMLEIGKPVNNVLTWLFNSHFFAVRKSLNGDVIYDPSRIVESDLLESDGTGTRIRLRPNFYGTDVRAAVHIVQGGNDVTGTHLRDMEIAGSLLQRVMGVSDNISGVMAPGGRRSATEVRTSTGGSLNRLKTQCEYMSALGFAPLAQQLLQTTQQMYTGEKMFKIVGDQVNNAQTFVSVTPDSIAGFYDYVAVDGTLPLDRFALVGMWGQLLAQAKGYPGIEQAYNIPEIFAWVAQLGGLKNIKQFKIQPVAQPSPGALPIGGMGNVGGGVAPGPRGVPGAAGGRARGGGDSGPVVPLPVQIPGVGQSG